MLIKPAKTADQAAVQVVALLGLEQELLDKEMQVVHQPAVISQALVAVVQVLLVEQRLLLVVMVVLA
jgi:hypothetical protein